MAMTVGQGPEDAEQEVMAAIDESSRERRSVLITARGTVDPA